MTRKLIDTDILVYAYDNSDTKKHEVAKELLKKLEENREGVLSIQNLVEFARVVSEKAKNSRPYYEVRSYVLQLANVYTVLKYDSKTAAEALHLASNYKIHFFDALIVATMEENFIEEMITENTRDFKKVPRLRATNPFE